jgi:D-arginine dehydrogenase
MRADFIIIGAGIAGASIAYWLSRVAQIVVIEREAQPGYHSTGRSAALFIESLGPPQVRVLTRASRAFFDHPPPGFAEHPILSPRGGLVTAGESERDLLDQHFETVRTETATARRLSVDETLALVPVLKRDRLVGSVYEPDTTDIDVHALHHGFLRGVAQHGGRIVCDAEARAIGRVGDAWEVAAGGQVYRAPVIVNAAGAWCDVIAQMAGARPLGLEPKRRTAFIFEAPAGIDTRHWPRFGGVDGSFYIKPEAGLLLGSPANADPMPPQDVQPEAIDIAIAVDRIETSTNLKVGRPRRVWAGLRSFVADDGLVSGYDTEVPGFFWLAGQGGYGIQTSPAMGEASAALALGQSLPHHIADAGLTAAMLGPARLRKE